MWKILRRKAPPNQQVTYGRFEIERDGAFAHLEYSLSGSVLELRHNKTTRKIGLSLKGVVISFLSHRFPETRSMRVPVFPGRS